MFDMQKIGQTIARLRKQNNITQMELADRLGISFQAVSNWERGNTMPDIAKLGELSQILGVSIDDILGNKRSAEIIDKINSGDKQYDIKPEELASVAPILKPEQAEEIAEDLDGDLTIDELASVAPFVSEEFLDKMVDEKLSKASVDIASISAIAPFLSGKTLDKVANRLVVTDFSKLSAIAPFLEDDTLARIAKDVKPENYSQLVSVAPFLDEKTLGEIAKKIVDTDGNGLIALAPFMDEDDLDEIAAELVKKKGLKSIIPLMPFLGNVEKMLGRK